MTKTASDSVAEVDVVVMLFEPYGQLTEAEQKLVEEIRARGAVALAVVNKTDMLRRSEDLTEREAFLRGLGVFESVAATSVYEKKGCEKLLETIAQYAVESPHYFPDDAYTDLPKKALVAEVIREKLLLFLRDELPHGCAVTVESFHERDERDLIDIDVNIYCEKKSHKGMIIGKQGSMLKKIATAARVECEEFLGARVNLQCWIKVKDDWRDNDFLLNNFGFSR